MKHTKATKQKLSEMRRGSKNPFWGKHHTPEVVAAMKARLKIYRENRVYDILPQQIRIPDESLNLGYLAAIVDGEGSIGFINRRSSKRPFIAIYNSASSLMTWLYRQTGKSGKLDGSNRGRKPMYTWRVDAARDIHALCLALLPILVIKKKNAVQVIVFLERKYGDRLKGGGLNGTYQ